MQLGPPPLVNSIQAKPGPGHPTRQLGLRPGLFTVYRFLLSGQECGGKSHQMANMMESKENSSEAEDSDPTSYISESWNKVTFIDAKKRHRFIIEDFRNWSRYPDQTRHFKLTL